MADERKFREKESLMDRRKVSDAIEEWFCEVESGYGIAGVAELFALLYHDAKRNLKYWSEQYERIEEGDQNSCIKHNNKN